LQDECPVVVGSKSTNLRHITHVDL